MTWMFWWLVLFVQGGAFTWVSRARNSGSVGYASMAGVFSHGLWFAAQVFLVVNIVERATAGDLVGTGLIGLFYITAMVAGQSVMMVVSMRWLEKGRRRVGAPAARPKVRKGYSPNPAPPPAARPTRKGVCAVSCGPGWRPGYCDPDCPNAPQGVKS